MATQNYWIERPPCIRPLPSAAALLLIFFRHLAFSSAIYFFFFLPTRSESIGVSLALTGSLLHRNTLTFSSPLLLLPPQSTTIVSGGVKSGFSPKTEYLRTRFSEINEKSHSFRFLTTTRCSHEK
jgi:hypothetical protein